MKTIANISAAILILFGVLFVWGAFSPEGSPGWIVIGIISIGIGFGLIWFASRKLAAPGEQKVTLNIDLSGDVDLEKFQCTNCGGNLSAENVKMVAGAPWVNCPYCGASYQISEKPKW
jgi:hypothetical protein